MSSVFILLWTGLNLMQSAWTFDSQWAVLLLCGMASAVSVILTAWQSTRGEYRSALRGLLFAGVYSVPVLILRFGLRSYLDESLLVGVILASAVYIPLYAGYCVAVQHKRKSSVKETPDKYSFPQS